MVIEEPIAKCSECRRPFPTRLLKPLVKGIETGHCPMCQLKQKNGAGDTTKYENPVNGEALDSANRWVKEHIYA